MRNYVQKKQVDQVTANAPSRPAIPTSGGDELNYLNSYLNLDLPSTIVVDSSHLLANGYYQGKNIQNIVGLDSLNNISDINGFISKANAVLPYNGILACKVYPKEMRKKTMHRQHPNPLIFYPLYFLDFIWRRVFPKLNLTQGLYDKIEGDDSRRVLALAEALGRAAAGGFEIINYRYFGRQVYFVARKVGKPAFDNTKSHGLIFIMSRISRGKQVKDFYKLRTMHLYAEHLQNFVYKENGLCNGDKFNDDFRVTMAGQFLRKYWLDELPMLFNLLRGDLKLVGVRPLSDHKFNLYSKELQDYRTKFKPGLIPPFYADMPESLEEVMDSEYRYLKSYEKAPFKTDFKYFFKALYNILIKKARSN